MCHNGDGLILRSIFEFSIGSYTVLYIYIIIIACWCSVGLHIYTKFTSKIYCIIIVTSSHRLFFF